MAATSISIANEALAEVAAESAIASLDERSPGAVAVKRVLQPVLDEMLDWSDWDFAITRTVLAEVANDRAAEWEGKFVLPIDFGEFRRLRAYDASVAAHLPSFGPYPFPWQDEIHYAYEIAAGHLYCNLDVPLLEYSKASVNIGLVPPLLKRAIVLEIAARIAMTLKKDKELARAKRQEAEVARERAIADHDNRHPKQQRGYISDVEYARAGILDGTIAG